MAEYYYNQTDSNWYRDGSDITIADISTITPGDAIVGDLVGLNLYDIDFTGVDFADVGTISSYFNNCNFSGVDFSGATFDAPQFENCNFTNTNLYGKITGNVSFMVSANFSGANIDNCFITMSDSWGNDLILSQATSLNGTTFAGKVVLFGGSNIDFSNVTFNNFTFDNQYEFNWNLSGATFTGTTYFSGLSTIINDSTIDYLNFPYWGASCGIVLNNCTVQYIDCSNSSSFTLNDCGNIDSIYVEYCDDVYVNGNTIVTSFTLSGGGDFYGGTGRIINLNVANGSIYGLADTVDNLSLSGYGDTHITKEQLVALPNINLNISNIVGSDPYSELRYLYLNGWESESSKYLTINLNGIPTEVYFRKYDQSGGFLFINSWVNSVYYSGGVATSLPESGTGYETSYSRNEYSDFSDSGAYFVNGQITSLDSNGCGQWGAVGYFINGQITQLNERGTGMHQGSLYINGSIVTIPGSASNNAQNTVKKYILINGDTGEPVNKIVWNGDSSIWQPPANTFAIESEALAPEYN